jgi:hypothetical protein
VFDDFFAVHYQHANDKKNAEQRTRQNGSFALKLQRRVWNEDIERKTLAN